jgi:GxxExxY protein
MSADPNHEDHEHEAHEGTVNHGLRIPSSLSPDADLAMSQTIGCAIAVHRALGPGFIESIYRKAMCIELESRNLAYEKERSIRVTYRGVEIPGQRVDFIVEGLIVLVHEDLEVARFGSGIKEKKCLRDLRVRCFVVKTPSSSPVPTRPPFPPTMPH